MKLEGELKTHRIVMNVVLIETTDFVVFLHLFALIGAALLKSNQQLTFDSTKSCKAKSVEGRKETEMFA